MSFKSAFSEVKKLVKIFEDGKDHYLSSTYNEDQTRKDFIDKFFIALGWDVNHEVQTNPYHQEVKVEYNIESKWADYSFHLSPNFNKAPKFLVEAKKPSVALNNDLFYFQTVRYGFSAGAPVSVLTDFHEFYILDCRFKPNIGVISKACVQKFSYHDYIEEETFAKIYYLFSRESVLNNSLEEYSQQLAIPKGDYYQKLLFKGAYKNADENLLDDIESYRETLAKTFRREYSDLTSAELTEYTQRTIDRLIFIRFVEDKLIEQNDIVGEFGVSNTAWFDFINQSKQFDQKYNGIVFKHHFIDDLQLSERADYDFKRICRELCQDNCAYHFNYIPVEIIGSIYERFLGHVVVVDRNQVKIEPKPEVKKAGGVFYTPQYIVDYIVENTVGRLIEGKKPDQIARLKFADISCGSGSFLLGVFSCLLKYHQRFYEANPVKAKEDGCIFQDGRWIIPIRLKEKILVNNIFGIDLDSQAIEVTQLSLYLKLLEEETILSVFQSRIGFKEAILPSLANNVICGNSIIEFDINKHVSLDEKLILNPFDFREGFTSIMENGGFDAIVGNPPWVSLSRKFKNDIFSASVLEYLTKKYSGNTYSPNLYEYFVKRGLELVKKAGGYFSLIVPDRLGYNDQFIELRRFILKNYTIEELLYKAYFPNIITDTLIFRIRNLKTKNYDIKVGEYGKNIQTKNSKDYLAAADSKFIFESDDDATKIINKLFQNPNIEPLGKIVETKVGVILDSSQIKDTQTNKKQIPLLKGRSINRYSFSETYYSEFNSSTIKGGTNDKVKLGAKEKVLLRKTGIRILSTYDNSGIFPEQSLYFLFNPKKEISLKYLTGLINSKLFHFVYLNKLVTNRDSTPQLKKVDLDTFPVYTFNSNEDTKKKLIGISNFVDEILEVEIRFQKAKTDRDKKVHASTFTNLDKDIDSLVYQLYDLSNEEVAQIEKFFVDSLKPKDKRRNTKYQAKLGLE